MASIEPDINQIEEEIEKLTKDPNCDKKHLANLFRQIYGKTEDDYWSETVTEVEPWIIDVLMVAIPGIHPAYVCMINDYQQFLRYIKESSHTDIDNWKMQLELFDGGRDPEHRAIHIYRKIRTLLRKESVSVPYLLDCHYYPLWVENNTSIEPDELFEELSETEFADRGARHMRYRGNMLKRSKFFLVDSLEQVPIYLYPGFSYASVVEEYMQIKDNALVAAIAETITENFGLEKAGGINHVIGTKYIDNQDNIGFHNDKPKTINPEVPIFLISSGTQRALSFRKFPTESDPNPKIEVKIPMEPGSLFVLGHKTNELYQHSIEPDDSKGARISLVMRNISYKQSMTVIRKKVNKNAERIARDKFIPPIIPVHFRPWTLDAFVHRLIDVLVEDLDMNRTQMESFVPEDNSTFEIDHKDKILAMLISIGCHFCVNRKDYLKCIAKISKNYEVKMISYYDRT